MFLGFDDSNNLIYEGSSKCAGYAVWPHPHIVPAQLLSKNENTLSMPSHIWLRESKFIFREDSFDPITRIRRGRMYEQDSSFNQQWTVTNHPAMPTNGTRRTNLLTFSCLRLSTKIQDQAHLTKVILGCGEAHSQWQIIGIERGVFGEDLVTLRAISNMGVLPEINFESIPLAGRAKVEQCVAAVVNTAYRTGPESVIDRCRDAAVALLSVFLSDRHLGAKTDDLGNLIKAMEKDNDGKQKYIVINSAKTLALLHARAKPNSKEKHGSPPIYEQDAELALQLLVVIIRDLGYSSSIVL